MLTIVRNLWHQDSLQFAKVIRDIAAARKMQCENIVFNFGGMSKLVFEHFGISSVELPDTAPPEYLLESGRVSNWWHKLEAIRQAIIRTGGPVLHLDWDTIQDTDVDESVLECRPDFQGRLRQYTRNQSDRDGSNKKYVYHGGCLYFRNLATINRAIQLHALPQVRGTTDEVAATKLADEMLGTSDPVAHRQSGTDNPLLYSTSRNVSDFPGIKPMFREGAVKTHRAQVDFITAMIKNQSRPKRARRSRSWKEPAAQQDVAVVTKDTQGGF